MSVLVDFIIFLALSTFVFIFSIAVCVYVSYVKRPGHANGKRERPCSRKIEALRKYGKEGSEY